jgi:hypothetical protein
VYHPAIVPNLWATRRPEAAIVDIEQYALRRDRSFVVRMLVGLCLAVAGGLFVYGQLTAQENVDSAVDILMGDDRASRDKASGPKPEPSTD